MIELKNINKSFGVGKTEIEAVKNINIHVGKGEIFGVIGFSGAGKSTLLRMVNLLEKPTSGEVNINGKNLLRLNEKELGNTRKKIGIIFQQFNLLSSYNVFDNVAEILRMNRVPKKEIQQKVEELLALVGLDDKSKQYPAQLSGGQKQRVGIARALAMDPEILLCDEATSALDPQTTDSILELLLSINKKLGLTIVLITHEMEVIKKTCDRVAVMDKGEVIEQGSVLDIFSHPQQVTTKNFLRNLYDDTITEEMMENLQGFGHSYILRLAFRGDSALDPVLHVISSKYSVVTNIVHGSINYLKGIPLGILMVHISGDYDQMKQAITYLNDTVYHAEVSLEINQNQKREGVLQ
ncbi:D-methionine transport system ATP-binding protein [Virgibacillus natechei]|uniref:D-methionine transport system ATP-binding protein n=1 Tax=Virgibacillus natechei TaxID=1216297 RepID=A0ABS4IK75_9BACI|nr:ATP-binding cassette domain-containing protein [Virgibacillus natechei]MBP1971372.1 D-methionine transport system ATP-binding protein [Virgibacillus natechei]UZD12254.1 ATP-binding cassette domain-containing protein [Virgibacillus natechei]